MDIIIVNHIEKVSQYAKEFDLNLERAVMRQTLSRNFDMCIRNEAAETAFGVLKLQSGFYNIRNLRGNVR